MARLTDRQWEQARAEYEVRGISLGEVAKSFGVATSSVSRKAKAEGWTQGKMQDLVAQKVACVKGLAEVNAKTQELPERFQWTIERVAKERLKAEGALAEFDRAIIQKGIELAGKAKDVDSLEVLARVHKHLVPPQPKETTTVNVSQQAGTMIRPLSPREALQELAKQAQCDTDFQDTQERA